MVVKALTVHIGNIHEIFYGDFLKGFPAHHLMHGKCNFLLGAVAHGITSISGSDDALLKSVQPFAFWIKKEQLHFIKILQIFQPKKFLPSQFRQNNQFWMVQIRYNDGDTFQAAGGLQADLPQPRGFGWPGFGRSLVGALYEFSLPRMRLSLQSPQRLSADSVAFGVQMEGELGRWILSI